MQLSLGPYNHGDTFAPRSATRVNGQVAVVVCVTVVAGVDVSGVAHWGMRAVVVGVGGGVAA